MAVVVKTNGIPFWGRRTTHFSLFQFGLGCSLGVQGFEMEPANGEEMPSSTAPRQIAAASCSSLAKLRVAAHHRPAACEWGWLVGWWLAGSPTKVGWSKLQS